MENGKFLKILVFSMALLNFINLTLASQVYAYEVQTHEGITKEIVAFYNLYFIDKPISLAEAEQMIAGSNLEDTSPRWLNHYYDPIHNRGLTSDFIPVGRTSSKLWARDRALQTHIVYNPMKNTTAVLYAIISDPEVLEMTDYTWERAIKDYIKGDKDRAFRALGQILHLIEDASVPDHTRNDPHIAIGGHGIGGEGSPYELWTNQFNQQNINLLQYLYLKKPIILNSLDEYFDAMANYSNRNFYSKDTIDSLEYTEPKSDYFVKVGKYFYGFKRDTENGDYKLIGFELDSLLEWATPDKKSASLEYGSYGIVSDYWERLAPKAVQYGAGVVNLFFKEVERLKNDPEFNKSPEKSLIGQIIDTVKGWFPEKDAQGFEEIAEVSLGNGEGLMVNGGGYLRVENQGSHSTQPSHNAPAGQARSETKDNKLPITPPAMQSQALRAGNNPARHAKQGVAGGQLPNKDENNSPDNSLALADNFETTQDNSEELSNLDANTQSSPTISLGADNQGSQSLETTSGNVCVYETSSAPIHAGVIINEVAWAGTEESSANEWMELKNINQADVDISNWQLIDKGDQIHITFLDGAKISAGGYWLLERTDDNSVPNIPADFEYVGALGNSDEGLRLFDGHCVLIDEVLANSEWPAGSSNPRRSMERSADLSWRTYSGTGANGVFGTPKAENTQQASSQSSSQGSPSISSGTSDLGSPSTGSGTNISHILISEVMAGSDGNNENEFVELYNPTDAAIDLTGYVLKKKNSSGVENNLVSSGAFVGSIASKSFFLIAHENYAGAKSRDLTYSANSQNLAYTNNSAVLYDAGGAKVDEATWEEIKKGESIERKALVSVDCVSAQGAGEFLGNGCDNDATADFETRTASNPQNRGSLPEPRDKPTALTGFNINYDKATLSVAFSWDYSTASGTTSTSSVLYILKDVSDGAVPIELVSLSLTGYNYKIKEIGRNYKYSIIAKDADGLVSEVTEKEVLISSFWKSFSANSENGIMEAQFDSYPFISEMLGGSPLWKMVVFGRSGAPISQTNIDHTTTWSPDAAVDLITYRNYAGEISKYSLILADDADHTGVGGGPGSTALAWGEIEDNRIRVYNDVLRTLRDAPGEYITASFYDYIGGSNETFSLIAIDATKYPILASAPENLLPTAPSKAIVETYLIDKRVLVSFDRSADPDGLDKKITYQVNAARVLGGEVVFDDSKWITAPEIGYAGEEPDHDKRYHTVWSVEDGGDYVFAVRAKDERGGFSVMAKTEPYVAP